MVCIKQLIQNLNIVIGCDIGCSYCYARNNARRFRMVADFASPEYFPSKLRLMERKPGRNLFLTGMSDFARWQPRWREEIFDAMRCNPHNQYVFLTKRPEELDFACDLQNAWFGVTVTCRAEVKRIAELRNHLPARHYHVTFEPMFDDVGKLDLRGIEWVVIGTETGSRKGRSVSERRWVESIAAQAAAANIPVFMKEDLLPIMGEHDMVQQLPPAFLQVLERQKEHEKRTQK